MEKAPSVILEIAAASAEQATGLEEINQALTQMDGATQQNSALVEENVATTRTLETEAHAMQDRVAISRFDEAGVSGEQPAPRAQADAALAQDRATADTKPPRAAPVAA